MGGGVKTLLSLKPIVWVGKLSYSLYLFHWIFIAFTYYISGEKELPQGAILPDSAVKPRPLGRGYKAQTA